MTYTLQVTDVHMKIKDGNGMKAICNIIINGMLNIADIRVIENKKGELFVAMPSKKMPDGNFKDMANPVNAQARAIIEEAVLGKYNELTTLSDELASILAAI